MTEHEHERQLPPAPVLPPPMAPSGYYAHPGTTPSPWPSQPPAYPSDLGAPPVAPPTPRGPAPPPGYPPYGYQAYGQPPGYPGSQPPVQWGYGGWSPPPPKRSSALARVALAVVGLGAAMLFALVILGAIVGDGAAGGQASDIDHAPAKPDRDNSQQNPSDFDAVLSANAVYAQGGLANLSCPAEDLGSANTEEQTRFYESLMTCLNDEWEPPIEKAGFRYAEPGLLVFDSPVNTPCGNASPEAGRRLAFYCPGDSVLYADVAQMRKYFGDIDVAYAILIGHEFGHHVQFETGVLDAYDDAVYDDYDQRLELSRRVELQASCMGGLFLGAIADSFPVDDDRLDILDRVAGSFGDTPNAPDNRRDHGSGDSNHDWIMGAFRDNDIGFCNTFTATDSAVD